MTAGWGETEVPMDVSSRRLALVLHRHLAEHGLLPFLSLLGAFLLNAIKRNQAAVVQTPDSGGVQAGGASNPEYSALHRLCPLAVWSLSAL